MEALSRIITDFYISKGYVSQDNKEVYRYGFKLIIADIVNFAIVLLLGTFLRSFFESIVFLVTLCSVRQFSGGFHAKTFAMCRISMIVTFVCVLALSNVFKRVNHIGLIVLINVVSTVIIYIFAPVENPNKQLTEKQKSENKNKAVIVSLVLSVISIVLYIMEFDTGIIMSITLASVVVLMLIAIIIRRGGKNNV